MKKFLIYSSGATAIVLVFGILTVLGFFDLSDGKAQLIGPSKAENTQVDIHNRIVEYVHDIGNQARDLNEEFKNFEISSDLNLVKNAIDRISQKRKSLEQSTINKQQVEDVFKETYIPAVIAYENSYKKLFAYIDAKPLDEASLASFKNAANEAFLNYSNAHNAFVNELNRFRKY